MKVIALLALGSALPSVAVAQIKLPPNHRVAPPKATQNVAKANSKNVTAADVEPYLWEWYGKEAIYEIVSYAIVTDDAAKRGVTVSDAEVEKEIDAAIKKLKKNPNDSPEQATAALTGQGFTRSRLFLRTKETLLIDKIVLSDFHPENYVKVSTILVKPKSADATSVTDAIKRCQDAYDQLAKGETWDKVLKSVTTDTKLLKSKGVLGWRSLSAFPDSVRTQIPSLPLGGYTRPAQTQFGIQFFRIDSRGVGSKPQDLAELKDIYLRDERAKYMTELKSRSNIQILIK